MILKELKLVNFKNLGKLSFNFGNGIYYFFAPNGTGKTNLLEAIQVLTVGKSLRSKSEIDTLPFSDLVKKLQIQGDFEDEDEISFKQKVELEFEPKKKKSLFLNKNKISSTEYLGRTPSIWFSPESIKIISSSPLNKRKYFDDILSQLFADYAYHLRAYNRSLKQRNRVLQNEILDKNQIKVWSENLITHGAKVIEERKKFFEKVNEGFAELKNFPRYKFEIEEIPNIKLNSIFNEDPEYKFRTELLNSYQKDLLLKTTSVGPHKDDWDLKIKILETSKKSSSKSKQDFISAERFASRGQQRMALIILQIVLINIFIKLKNIVPILLLDDIFSELDKENEKILLDFIHEKEIQTFITGVHEIGDEKIEQIDLSKEVSR